MGLGDRGDGPRGGTAGPWRQRELGCSGSRGGLAQASGARPRWRWTGQCKWAAALAQTGQSRGEVCHGGAGLGEAAGPGRPRVGELVPDNEELRRCRCSKKRRGQVGYCYLKKNNGENDRES